MSTLDVKGAKNPYRSFVDCRTEERIAEDEKEKVVRKPIGYEQLLDVSPNEVRSAPIKDSFKKGYIPYD
jgi:hypothetical protein